MVYTERSKKFVEFCEETFGNGKIKTMGDPRPILIQWFVDNIKENFCLHKEALYQYISNQYAWTMDKTKWSCYFNSWVNNKKMQSRIKFGKAQNPEILAQYICTSHDGRELFVVVSGQPLKTMKRKREKYSLTLKYIDEIIKICDATLEGTYVEPDPEETIDLITIGELGKDPFNHTEKDDVPNMEQEDPINERSDLNQNRVQRNENTVDLHKDDRTVKKVKK
jgi:hypothetical protein